MSAISEIHLRRTMETMASLQSLYVLLGSYFVYLVSRTFYRLWFHPLSFVPGPRFAAISDLWLIYWDAIRGEGIAKQLPRLHRKYGRLVRISPNEVHIYDPEIYHHIYKGNTSFQKAPSHYRGFQIGSPTSFFTMTDPIAHKPRRRAADPLFSTRAISKLEGLMQGHTDTLCSRISALSHDGLPIPLEHAFYCITVDTISSYCFGKSFDTLKSPDFSSDIVDSVLSVSGGMWMAVHFPGLVRFIKALPLWIARLIAKPSVNYRMFCENEVRDFLRSRQTLQGKQQGSYETIFDCLVNDTPDSDFNHLVDEAITFLAGGSDTNSETLTYCIYYFLTQEEARRRVLEELDALPRDTNGQPKLQLDLIQNLPYLTAFIKEVFRTAHIAPGRFPRVVPSGGITVPSTGQHIPEGAVVSVALLMINNDPDIHQDPWTFNPERWINNPALDHWFLPFGRGPRACIGITFAWAELYIVLANLFSRFEMTLYDTLPEDMEWVDRAVTHPKGTLKIMARERVLRV